MERITDDLGTESLTPTRSTSAFGGNRQSGGSTFNNIKQTVADKLESAAGAVRSKVSQPANQSGAMSNYGSQASDLLHRSADYVRDLDVDKMKTDVQKEVRQNPGRSLLIAGAAGLILGALLRRR